MQILQPPGWPKPKGYSNGVVAEGRQVYVAGQIGWDETETVVSDNFAAQVRQALLNTVLILSEADAEPQHIVRMTWYVTDKQQYLNSLREIGSAYRQIIGKHYPTMAVVQVTALVEDRAKVEIETTAVVPKV